VDVRPWACFNKLAEVMPANVVEAKKIQVASAIVTSVDVVEKVAVVLNMVASPIMLTSVGGKNWRVGFSSVEERDNFLAMGLVFKYKDIKVEVVEKLFRYKVCMPTVVGFEELFDWFQQYYNERDIVSVVPVKEGNMWMSETKVVMRKPIDRELRVRVGIRGGAFCRCISMTEQWKPMFWNKQQVKKTQIQEEVGKGIEV
jgi:hypothetical protein